MDSLEGFSPEDTTGFIAIQGRTHRASDLLLPVTNNIHSYPSQEVRSSEAQGWRAPHQLIDKSWFLIGFKEMGKVHNIEDDRT